MYWQRQEIVLYMHTPQGSLVSLCANDKEHDIKESFGQGCSVPGDINSGRSFRTAFETFCRKEGEHRVTRLEAKFLPSYKPITELARAVDQSAAELQHLPPNDTLESLIWWMSFAVIQVRRPYFKTTHG